MEGGLFSWAKKQVDDVFRKKEHILSDCNIVLNHKKVQAVSEGWGGGEGEGVGESVLHGPKFSNAKRINIKLPKGKFTAAVRAGVSAF